jgi:flagellar biosynthesis protein FlhG
MPEWPDQASTLRRSLSRPAPAAGAAGLGPKSISIASGKGGVGKTFVATNVAIALAQEGRRVLLIDADLSLANVHILLGLRPQWNLSDVVRGERAVEEILLEGPGGFHILPAGSGIPELASLSPQGMETVLLGCHAVVRRYDLVLADLSAGVSATVMAFLGATRETVLVTTPEPTAYTDAYALLKMMRHRKIDRRVRLVVNAAESEKEGRTAAEGLVRIGKQFLGMTVEPLAVLTKDPQVPRSTRDQRPVLLERPRGRLGREIRALARRIGEPHEKTETKPFFHGLGDELRKTFLRRVP